MLSAAVLVGAGDDDAAKPQPTLPHLRIDREKRTVDIDATIIRHGTAEDEWLELLACTEGGRDHESVVVVKAKPSHIHLALIMIGLEPGSPMRWSTQDNQVKIEKLPTGPRVAVTALFEHERKTIEVKVNDWVFNKRTKKPLADNIWLFTGSRFVEYEAKRFYLADLNGSVLSLVNFGDELLARPTKVTQLNDDQIWVTHKGRVPPKGTPIKLRLRPAPPVKAKKDEPQKRQDVQREAEK